MNNHQLWILIQDAYNSNNFYQNISIESYDNWYRIDKYYDDNSISLKILREYSIVHSSCEYKIELRKNGQKYRQTQYELIQKVIDQEFVPIFREIKLDILLD